MFGKRSQQYLDKIYDGLSKMDGDDNGIAAPELYVGILLLFNNINKYSPGKWVNPPSKKEVFEMLEMFDTNNDKVLNRTEFHAFCSKFFPEVTKKVMRDLFVAFVVTPFLIYLVITHLTFVKKILPEAVIGAILVSLLNALGVFRLLDDFLDRIIPGTVKPKKNQQPVAQAYPQGYPQGYPGAPPSGPYPPYPPAPGAPVPGYPAAPGAAPAAPVESAKVK